MDMCNGPILGKLIIFAVPLMLSGFLQLFFNAMDIVVVGKFSGSQALAAVGSTGALINLFVNVFIGFSIGANVLVAQFFGAKDEKNMQETVHTSILLALIGGVILIVGGFLFAGPMLELMGTPDDVLDSAVLYIHIYFIGMPAMLVYNFGASILRAIGDTRRPLYYLFTAGIVNVVLNLFFVIVLHMDVAGVATATVISQTISASLIVRCLVRSDGMYRLDLRKLHIYKSKLIRIVQIGLPAGMQGAVFFDFQCADPVIHQFVRLDRYGRKYSCRKY
jgi:putative MATE family efflux protein